MSEKIIRVGIAGQGRSGFDIHASWLRKTPHQYKIVAVADQNPKFLEQARNEFGWRAYSDYHQLIKDGEVDLFVNALPSLLHPKASMEALKAGRNVISEKPAATKVADFDKVVATAKKAGRKVFFFQNSRFYPFFIKMQEIINSGAIGDVVFIRSNWSGFGRRWDWQTLQKNWGGSLNNTGPHPMDHAVVLFGPAKPKVFAVMKSGPGSYGDADDFTSVTLYGKGSPTIEIVLNAYQAYPMGEMYNVCGTLGGIAGGAAGLKWKHFDPKKAPKQKLQDCWIPDRKYCGEQLPWVEETWAPQSEPGLVGFDSLLRGYYNNIYDVMMNKGKLIVTHEQVRRQIDIFEECHRQNPLPKLAVKNKARKSR